MLNTADQLRFYINDQPRQAIETRYGDGTATTFQVSGVPIITGATAFGGYSPSAYLPVGGTAWSATGSTFNYPLGTVTFSAVISANSAFQVSYTYATFSDQEIDHVVSNFGDVNSMKLALVDNLMANSYKRARWAAQAGSLFDDSQTMANLMMMRSAIRAEMTTEQGPLGGFISTDENQQVFG